MISLPVLTFMSHFHIVGEAFKDSDFTSSGDLHEPLSYSGGKFKDNDYISGVTFTSHCHIVGEEFKVSDFTYSVVIHESMSYSRGGIQGQ